MPTPHTSLQHALEVSAFFQTASVVFMRGGGSVLKSLSDSKHAPADATEPEQRQVLARKQASRGGAGALSGDPNGPGHTWMTPPQLSAEAAVGRKQKQDAHESREETAASEGV